jgi:nicotinamide-nucleotide amidase
VTAASEEEANQVIAPIEAQIQQICGLDCFGVDQETLASVVGKLLNGRGQTLAVAESCTGGGIGQAITTVPGSSRYFMGGVIAYDNRIKQTLLNVDPTVLDQHGAVSAEVAEHLAVGVRSLLQTDWGLSVTGIAGPEGGTSSKPVGLVHIGLAGPQGQPLSVQYQISPQRGREWVRQITVSNALDLLRRTLINSK